MKEFGKRLLLVIIAAMSFFSGYSQSEPQESSLLWKISGNNLKSPSYLYGTMHLKDKRLFNFSDSLYHFLEKAEGFYIEVDPAEVFNRVIQQYRNQNSSDQENVKDTKEDSKNEKSNKKDQENSGENLKNDQMDSFMDLYLFNIAMNKGKRTGGLEDYEDQVNEDGELQTEAEDNSEGIEEMIKIYLRQDLDEILYWLTDGSYLITDKSLIQRNEKMVHRIDSLSALSSNFYAVGAAHLPGDVGIIELLKKKGYTVDPVISSKFIKPDDYNYEKSDRNWGEYSPSPLGWKNIFPSTPVEDKSDALSVYWSGDFLTGTVYFVMDIEGNKHQYTKKEEEDLHKRIKRNFQKDGKIRSEKTFSFNGSMAKEYQGISKGKSVRMRVIRNQSVVHILMAVGDLDPLNSSNSEKFFSDFTVNKNPVSKSWVTFRNKEKAYSVDLPLQPEFNENITNSLASSENLKNWNIEVYTAEDKASDMFYMITAKNPKPGLFLLDDQSLFNEVISTFENRRLQKSELKKKGEYNTMFLNAINADGIEIHNYQINRGNNNYILLVMNYPGRKDTTAINRFINSFKFLDFSQPALSRQYSPDATISTYVPDKFELIDNGENRIPTWVAHDQNAAVNYQVDRLSIGKYYEAESDSAFFKELRLYYLDSTENEFIKTINLKQGKADAHEVIAKDLKTSNYKRFRFIPNKDTVYVVHMIGQKEIISGESADRFFDSLKIYDEYAGKFHLEKKSGVLFNDLYYGTEHSFRAASAAIADFKFKKEDLGNLHEALLEPFYDFNIWDYCTHDYLVKKVAEMGDSSSIQFIKENVYALEDEKEALKYPLLGGLLQFQTTYSYNIFKELIDEKLPSTGNPLIIANIIDDSLAKETGLIPLLLSKSNDSLFIRSVSQMAASWLREEYINSNDLLPYKEEFLRLASEMLNNISKEQENSVYNLMYNLISIGDEECLNVVKAFENSEELFASYAAVRAMVRMELAPERKNIDRLAASVFFRVRLFETLKGTKLSFPSKYSSTKLLGESEIFLYASDRYTPSKVDYLKSVKKKDDQGNQVEYHLYKVTFDFENGKEEYLGVTGPFNPKIKSHKGLSDINNIYTDELFNNRNYEEQFKKHLNNYIN